VSDDIFDDFAPEPGGIGSGTIRISDILARGVSIRWDEAVALLQEILENVTTAGGANASVPAFENVIIDRQGAVSIHGKGGERGPVAAGRALHALLATADIPVPLRLFVTQANAPETHKSLQSFAEGLAYFGRPGRDELIRAIYERYRTSAPTVAPSPGRPATPPPLPHTARDEQVPELRRRGLPPWLVPAAAVFAIVSLGAVVWFGLLGGSTSAASAVTQVKAAVGTVATALQGAPKPATNTTVSAEKAPAGPADKARPSLRSQQSSAQGTRPRKVAASPANLENGSFATPSVESLLTAQRTTQAPPAESTAPTAPSITVAREYVVAPRENAATTIYSPADADVQPPVMMYPSLPPTVFVARNADVTVINRMELVIAADGSVERVRLVNGPTRMPDMMLLSGAKLWKFAPAVKDGVPVRYRTTVTWSGFP
jgi:outer membrane biosynthesis protein TonB